uniref:Uncharacterized protein n=1 Tax=viral metagenome TaxID=1070528 RepID=A0A6C0J7F8_9ZZZZ
MYNLRNRIIKHVFPTSKAKIAPTLDEMTLTMPILQLTDLPSHKSMSTFKPVVAASQVAALIGRNPYNTFNDAAMTILSKDPVIKTRITEMLRKTQRTQLSQVKTEVFRAPAIVESKRVTEEAVKKADAATQLKIEFTHAKEAVRVAAVEVATVQAEAVEAETAVRVAIETHAPAPVLEKLKEEVVAKKAEAAVVAKKVEKLEVEATVKKVAAETAAKDAPNIDEVIAKHVEVVRQAVTNLPVPAEVKVMLEKEANGDIVKARGNRDENLILDAYEKTENVVVEERNTRHLRLDMGKYVITGRTDGWVASKNRVVDAKNRQRKWPTVPVYDIVQLRVYMKMIGCPDSEIAERFTDGTTRNTVYTNDPKEWARIQSDLEEAVERLIEMSQDETVLQRVLNANTVASF